MLSNVNIHQNFDGLLVEVKFPMDTKNMNEHNLEQEITNNAIFSDSIRQNQQSNTDSNGSSIAGNQKEFSILEKDIDFHENFQSNYNLSSSSLSPITKDSKRVNNQLEPNHLLKTINNNYNINSKEISAICADIQDVHNYSKSLQSLEIEKQARKDSLMNNGKNPQNNLESSDRTENKKNNLEDKDSTANSEDSRSTSKDTAIPKTFPDIVEEKSMPEHHARRPMNAFLIFCKRHRAIVREKYPNLENRSITKILGDWWASLDVPDKTCYTNLAKQYKDAFFSANPNFKWYKLPAPPLRTLATRPINADRPMFLSNINFPYVNPFETYISPTKESKLNRIKIDSSESKNSESSGKRQSYRSTNCSNMGMFKLADEAQMGGLSSLMIDTECKGKLGNNNIGEGDDTSDSSNAKQKALQNALSETSSFFEETMDSLEPLSNMRSHASKMQCEMDVASLTEQNTAKSSKALLVQQQRTDRFPSPTPSSDNLSSTATTTESSPYPVTLIVNNIPEKIDEYEFSRKVSRACKGKRYLEFMSSGKLSPVSKKSRFWSTSLIADSGSGGDKTEYYVRDHLYANIDRSNNYILSTNRKMPSSQSSMPNLSQPVDLNAKLFDASDFDLEEKIKLLPALSLDKYLMKKRETKKKKKINQKRVSSTVGATFGAPATSGAAGQHKPPQTIHEAREQIQNSMVGSQKRKARKESITRRDVNPEIQTDGEIEIKEEIKQEELVQVSPNSDLFILATLAATYEVD